MAASQEFEPIFFLDADNWSKPNHVEITLGLRHKDSSIDAVISGRTIALKDATLLHSGPPRKLLSISPTHLQLAYFNVLSEALLSGP